LQETESFPLGSAQDVSEKKLAHLAQWVTVNGTKLETLRCRLGSGRNLTQQEEDPQRLTQGNETSNREDSHPLRGLTF
jgi:hypothetical protein